MPFLGAGAAADTLPLGGDIARKWASEYGYPLPNNRDLAAVAQFVSIQEDPMTPKEEISDLIRREPKPDLEDPGEPHNVLAMLPFPVYLTTNYDDSLARALEFQGKRPRVEYCRWNDFIKDLPSILDEGEFQIPLTDSPLVFHLHGKLDVPESIVISEDDYLAFLLRMGEYKDLVPSDVTAHWRRSSLLFIGYSIADLSFRVLFQGIQDFLGKSLARRHIAVQLGSGQSAEARTYLEKKLDNQNISVYWGSAREFVAELTSHWEALDDG